MKNCLLFFAQDDREAVAEYIAKSFSKTEISIKGQVSNWTEIKVVCKTGWFGQSAITLSAQYAKHTLGFEAILQGLTNLAAKTAATEDHHALINHIKNTQLTVSIFANSGYVLFLDIIFHIAKTFDAVVLIDALFWKNGDNKLLLDMSAKWRKDTSEVLKDDVFCTNGKIRVDV